MCNHPTWFAGFGPSTSSMSKGRVKINLRLLSFFHLILCFCDYLHRSLLPRNSSRLLLSPQERLVAQTWEWCNLGTWKLTSRKILVWISECFFPEKTQKESCILLELYRSFIRIFQPQIRVFAHVFFFLEIPKSAEALNKT